MRRVAITGFALLATLLIVSAPVEAAATNTAIGSQHTTDTDFNNATTLDNVTVSGAGADAFVELATIAEFTDDFDSEAADSGIPDNWEAAGTWDTGDAANVSTQQALTGTQSVYVSTDADGSDQGIRPMEQPFGTAKTANISVSIYAPDGDRTEIKLLESGTRLAIISMRNGDLQYWDGTWNSISTTPNTDEWVNVTVYNFDTTADTYAVEWSAPGGSGTSTGLSMENAATNGYTDTYLTSSNADGYFDAFRIGSSEFADASTYISQTHSVDNAVTAKANLSNLNNVEVDVTVLADTNGDGTFETEAATNTFTTAGNKSLDISATSATDWRLNVTFVKTGANPTGELHDEAILFTNHEPLVDNGSGTPTGVLTQSKNTLQLQINDTEFGLAQGDSITVEFFVDNTSVGTDTLTANGTAQLTHTFSGGDHTWHVVASDDYGLSNTSQFFSVRTPANLTIREEVSPHSKVTAATATVTFYETVDDNPTIARRTAEDANITMAGLPTTAEFAVTVSAPGYYNRTVLIDDIFTQSTVFLLPTEQSASAVTYTIEDETGQFVGEGASIVVQRAINQSEYDSGGFSWMTIAGDRTGAANELTMTLEDEVRYRLRVSDGAGDTRIVGAHTVVAPDTVTLRPTAPDINVTDLDTWEWNATIENTTTGERIVFEFADPEGNTTDMLVQMYEQGNRSNRFANQTIAGPITFTRLTQSLTAEQADKNWVVEFSATRNGETISDKVVISQSTIGQITQLVPWVRHAIAALVIVLTAGLFSLVNVESGAVVTSFIAGGFWYVQWLPTAAGPAIGVALFVALFWKAASRRGG